MLKITSDGANKLLRELQLKKNDLYKEIRDLSVYVAAVSEDEKNLKPEFDFEETVRKIEKIENQIIALRYAKNQFNNETVLPCGMTIGEVLVKLPLLSEAATLYESMATRQPKARRNYKYGEVPREIEYEYVNYDIKVAKEKYEATRKKILELQQMLNFANATITFEVDVDL